MTDSQTTKIPPARLVVALGLLAWLAMFLIRWSAPSDLMSRDQERVGTYILDISLNGNWLCQQDIWGNIASKPPLFNWLAALPTLAFGELSRLTLCFPSWLCSFLVCCLLLVWGGRHFGRGTALWAAPLYLFSLMGMRQVLLARNDTVFQLTIFAGALAAYRAWQNGRGWVWFWLLGAAAMLTKGPFGVALAASGLLAYFWERRSGMRLPVQGAHWLGIGVFLAITAAWFFAADDFMEGRVYDKLIRDEFVGHIVGKEGETKSPGLRFYKPVGWLLHRLAPMGAVLLLALWRVFRRPAADLEERRFERFLSCIVLTNLILVSLAANNRFVHLLPLMPPAALLAGREVSRWLRTPRRSLQVALPFLVGFLSLAAVYLNVIDGKSRRVVESENMRQLAPRIEARFGAGVWQWNAPTALFLHMNVFLPPVEDDRIGDVLRGDQQVVVIVRDRTRFEALAKKQGVERVYELMRAPLNKNEDLFVLSNRAAIKEQVSRTPSGATPAAGWLFMLLVGAGMFGAGRRVVRLVQTTDRW